MLAGKNEIKEPGKFADDDDDDDDDLADKLPPEVYCDLIETLNDKCGEYSLLEIWKYNEATIRGLTVQDIVDAVNTVDESPVFGYDTDFTDYLGGIKRCACPYVVSFIYPLTYFVIICGEAVRSMDHNSSPSMSHLAHGSTYSRDQK